MTPDLAAAVLTRAAALPPLASLEAGAAAARRLDDARSALGILTVHLRTGFLLEDAAVRMAARRLRGAPVLDDVAYCRHDLLADRCQLCPLEDALSPPRLRLVDDDDLPPA